MKRFLVTCLALGLFMSACTTSFAQNAAADFDGSGYVQIPNVGSEISSAPGLTMMGWIYPRNTVPGFPNFDGFFGFRNDATFDFYMLQLNPTNLEVRFRNSTTANFDIVSTSLVLNEWQHIAMVYDGTTLAFYRNGMLDASTPASGSIVSFGEPLQIGNIFWSGGGVNFYTDGQIDNVQLWKRALTAAEIIELHCRESIDAAMYPDLVSQYVLNDSTGVTTTPDVIGTYPGNIIGTVTFVPSGVDACDAFEVSTAISICDGDSVPFDGGWLTTTGTYVDTLTSTGGLDSIVILDLTVFAPVATPVISQPNDSTLTCTAGDTYQWYLDGTALAGEVNQDLYDPVPGVYTVVVTDSNGCVSAVSNEIIITLPPPSGLAEMLENGLSIVQTADGIMLTSHFDALELQAFSLDGRLQMSQLLTPGVHHIKLSEGDPQMLLLHLRTDQHSGTLKVLK